MDERKDRRPRISPAQAERNVESVVLALVIRRYPTLLATPELIAELAVDPNPPGRGEAIERAVAELVRVDLLRPVGPAFEPTAAALRAGELELGL